MLGSILMIVVYVVVGAAVVVGGVLGAAWLLAREINAGHEPSCTCPTCQGRRLRRWRAQHGQDPSVIPTVNQPRPQGRWREDRKPPPTRSTWISTLELSVGMHVYGKVSGSVFRVEAVDPRPFGYQVVLINVLTGKISRMPVQGDKAQHRIWLVRRPRGSVE